MKSHFFFRQFRFCFISLNMLNVGEFSLSWLSGTPPQLRKRKKNSSSCVYVRHKTPHKNVVVQWRQRNESKSAKLLFCLSKAQSTKIQILLLFFFTRNGLRSTPVNPDAEIALFWNPSPERFKAPSTWMRIKNMRFPKCPNSCGHSLNQLLFWRSRFCPRRP